MSKTTTAPKQEKKRTASDMVVSRKDVKSIYLNDIDVMDDFNARDFTTEANQEHVRKLARQIKEHGQLNPVSVFFDKTSRSYKLIDGESRFRALKLLQEELRSAGKNEEADQLVIDTISRGETAMENKLVMMLQSNEGRPLTDSEKAKSAKKLKDVYDWNAQEISEKTGWSYNKVLQLLKFAEFPKAIFKMVDENKVAFNTALLALKQVDGNYDKAAKLLKEQHQEKAEAIIEDAAEKVKTKVTAEDSEKIIQKATKQAKKVKVTSSDLKGETKSDGNKAKTSSQELNATKTASTKFEGTVDAFIETLESKENDIHDKLANVLTMLKDLDAGNVQEEAILDYIKKNF